MSSLQIIAERAAEKRRQDPLYHLSLAELKAVDAVLIVQARRRLAVDVCLNAESNRAFTLTEAQRRALSFAALCEAEALQKGREKHEPEVQEAIASLWEARRILEEVPA